MSLRALTPRIAWRYLCSRKSYSAVSAVSIVAVTGVAIATAAIICVLSVFNGFRSLLNQRLDTLASDVKVMPAAGKTFADADSIVDVISQIPGVEFAMPAVSDQALVISSSREMPVKLLGVRPEEYSRLTAIDSLIFDGATLAGDNNALISIGVASRLGIYASGSDMLLFAPKRIGRINMASPLSSFISDSVSVNGIFQTQQSDYDENLVICNIDLARDLFQYTTEASSVEIKAEKNTNPALLATSIQKVLGPEVIVKDKIMQQEMNFRMVSIEKWVTFLLLVFILIIASFNIISTMCMLVLEKESSLSIFSALGMKKRKISMTFWWESIYVSIGGGIAGVVLGIVLSLLQEKFGFIKINGNEDSLTLSAYPVVVEWIDILWALIPIFIIGFLTAYITKVFAGSRIT